MAPSPVPYVYGGAENLFWKLTESINDLTEHNADLIKLPVKEDDFWSLVDSYRRFYYLDLSHFDMVISTKYPAWMVQHNNHIVYLLHHLRGLFDTYHFSNEPYQVPEIYKKGKIEELLSAIIDPELNINTVFTMLEEIREDSSSYDQSAFRFPGPLIRAIIHYFDSHALAPKRISRYFSISNNVIARKDYFPHGVRVEAISPPSKLKGLRSEGYEYIFTASRLEGPKRLDILINSMKHISHNIKFKIAGTGPDEDRLKKLASGDNRIEFMGFVNDKKLADLYSKAMVVPYIPYDEDYGLITIEAMKSMKPVITASDSGGTLEFVKDFETGFVVKPDPKCLADKINYIIEHPDDSKKMGLQAYHATENITWNRLISRLLETEKVESHKKQRILVLCTYSSYPPRGGGQHRLYNLYSNLAINFDVIICSITPFDTSYCSFLLDNGLRQICIPQSREHAEAQWNAEHKIKKNLYDVCMIDFVEKSKDYVNAVKQFVNGSDIVIFSHPYLFGLSKLIEKDKLIVYESHNVEFLLKKDYVKDHELVERIKQIEKEACMRSDEILTTSKEDKKNLEDLYDVGDNKIIVASNGVDIKKIPLISEDEKLEAKSLAGLSKRHTILFIGSWHPPNLEALEFIIDSIASKFKGCAIIVIGSIKDYYLQKHKSLPNNILAFGTVDEEEKYEIYKLSDIAINPMFSGSGTNLKMLDYMSAGIPVITTAIGARGLDVESYKHAIICPPDEFPKKIVELLEDKALQDKLKKNGRALVEEKFSWQKIASNVNKKLRSKAL